MTGVLRDVVRDALVGCPDIEVIEAAAMLPAADTYTPTTVVCTGEAVRYIEDVLYRHPRLRILTVEGDGRRGYVYELVPHELPLGELSPRSLLAAVRGDLPRTDREI